MIKTMKKVQKKIVGLRGKIRGYKKNWMEISKPKTTVTIVKDSVGMIDMPRFVQHRDRKWRVFINTLGSYGVVTEDIYWWCTGRAESLQRDNICNFPKLYKDVNYRCQMNLRSWVNLKQESPKWLTQRHSIHVWKPKEVWKQLERKFIRESHSMRVDLQDAQRPEGSRIIFNS